jgi:CheY-like chemotaxis protein
MILERTAFSPAECLRKAAQTFYAPARSKGLTLDVEISPEIPGTVIGDSVRLRQIVLNLVGNAVRFTSRGYVRVSASADGELVRVAVEDSGLGIAEDQLKSIFEPFHQADVSMTRSYGGTGLGLSIVAELVKLMDGTVEVASEPGVGSRFSIQVRLPKAATAPAPLPPAPEPEPVALTILVAEDNPVNQLVTSRLLERWGHHVSVVPNGLEALEALGRSCFDLVLMDVQMPVMDGLEATRRIRAREGSRSHTPIVALTAHALSGDEQTLRAAGMDAYLAKPLSSQELKRVLAGIVSSRNVAGVR